MLGLFAGPFFSKYGLYLLLALAFVALAASLWFGGKASGAAAAKVDSLRESIKRTEEADRARRAVKPNDREAMKNDPFNRDNAGGGR